MSGRIPSDAFEFYVALGPGRSYQAVASHYGVTKRAVAKKATQEGWQERLDKVEREAQERSDRRLVDTLGEMRERHLKTVRAIHSRALTGLKEYPLSTGMEAIRAAELAIKLERLIAGEPSERTELTVEEVTKREMNRWLEPPKSDDDGEA